MIVSKDKRSAYLCGVRNNAVPCDYDRYVALNGLSEDLNYRIEELGVKASGKILATKGVYLPKIGDFESWTWHIVAED